MTVNSLRSQHAMRRRDRSELQDLHARNWHHEPASPVGHVRMLRYDLLAEIPWQNQYVIRPRLPDRVGIQDRNTRAGGITPLFVWAAVDGEVEKVLPDSAI